ncbi:hypothetical protein GCM10009127_00170 [Alteraurantiacibacter aestuarii]
MLAGLATSLSAAARGQEAEVLTAEQAIENSREYWSVEPEDTDDCADAQAEDPDVIVVCRDVADPERYTFERPPRADVEVTGSGAPRAQDPGGMLMPCSAYTLCVGKLGRVPPPAVVTDFDALPETPAGSEAARLYGGPTDADDIAAATRAAQPVPEPVDTGAQTKAGLEDDVYGP